LRGRFYCYCYLPFGIKCSAFVFCEFAGVTADYVRSTGLTTALTQYVDDFLGSVGQAPDFDRLRKVIRIFRFFGWLLKIEKLDLRLATRIKGLGFMLDSNTMSVGVPERRRLKLQATAEAVLARAKACACATCASSSARSSASSSLSASPAEFAHGTCS